MNNVGSIAAEPLPRYRILMEIGSGGMGVVHLAMTRGPQGFVKLIVLKTLQPNLIGNEAAQRMFLDEARILARLTHPNVVHVYEVTTFGGLPTIVMEYLEGRSLSIVLGTEEEKGSLPDTVAAAGIGRLTADAKPPREAAPSPPASPLPLAMHLHVISQVLAGLHAVHELRDYDGTPLDLIHRDVSPHNVFLLFDGQIKVLDFGIAKATRSKGATETGEIKGKIRYMAPEQLLGEHQDRRVDVFAAGVMLWEALAGRRLWADRTDSEVIRAIVNDTIPPLPAEANIPPGLAAICAKAMASDVQLRYATADAFQRDLDRQIAELSDGLEGGALSKHLSERFGRERESLNKIIDAHVKSSETPETLTLTSEAPPGIRAAASGERRKPLGGDTAPTGPGRRWQTWAIAGGAALIAVIGLAYRAVERRDPEGPTAGKGNAMRHAGSAAADGPAHRTTCEAGFKLCAGECVSIDRPDVGCGSDECLPCEVHHATSRCNLRHACDIAVCYQDHDNCDGDGRNGCETEIRTDPDNCGSCGHKCPPLAHAVRGCGDVCTIWRCEAGFRDCNGEMSDGCEVRVLEDPRNCGHCGVVCSSNQRCRAGRCAP